MSKIYVAVGLPASGKSTWAKQHKDELNAIIHSSDTIREELFNDVNEQNKNELVFKTLHRRIKDDLKAGKNVIYDATSLNRRKRVHFLNNELKGISCEKICVLFACPFELSLARNFARDRRVPEDVMVRMYKSFDTPTVYEGFDDVKIVWADYKGIHGFEYNFLSDLNKLCSVSHDNPHHSKTIGDHMIAANSYYHSNFCNVSEGYSEADKKLGLAILMHDCGKIDTKAFIDSKGEECDIAHYYNHEAVSAYKSLFYLRNMNPEWSNKDILYVSLLINLHMRAHTAWKQSDKAKDKDRRLFGNDVIRELELIFEADIAAH